MAFFYTFFCSFIFTSFLFVFLSFCSFSRIYPTSFRTSGVFFSRPPSGHRSANTLECRWCLGWPLHGQKPRQAGNGATVIGCVLGQPSTTFKTWAFYSIVCPPSDCFGLKNKEIDAVSHLLRSSKWPFLAKSADHENLNKLLFYLVKRTPIKLLKIDTVADEVLVLSTFVLQEGWPIKPRWGLPLN